MVAELERLPRVVLADDHPSVLAALACMLRGSCEVVATAPTGSGAIEAVTRFRPDVLVVDLMMPDMDGLAVCRSVTLAVPHIDVVIVTAFADASVEHVALRDGAAAFRVNMASWTRAARRLEEGDTVDGSVPRCRNRGRGRLANRDVRRHWTHRRQRART
jgi:CheY-like chemotaxis protein